MGSREEMTPHPCSPPSQHPRIIVITGPTGSGKSDVAMALAERVGGEILSADSMQVYRELDIGTAKPTREERDRVRHHLIDVAELDEPYSAGRFRAEADAAIADMARRGKPCLVVGGTALYIKALLEGLLEDPGRDPKLRAGLARRWEAGEAGALFTELQQVDPELADRLHPNDRSRILRGLEVWQVSGRPLSEHQRNHSFADNPYETLRFGMEVERETLYQRIDRRVVWMLERGWVDEVRALLDRGYDPGLAPLQAIGYKQLCRYVRQGGDLDETAADICQATRNFAKRQMTWMRKMALEWMPPSGVETLVDPVKKFLQIP